MEIDWWTLALQTVNFLVVVWLLSRFLFRPIRRMIEAREASDRAAADEAQKKTEEAENLRADYERRLTEFDELMGGREAELHYAMQREREQALSDARKDAEDVRATARAEIADARTRALSDLRAEIAALARELAEKALLDVPADPLVCLEAVLARREESELARIRQDLASEGTLAVVTADGPFRGDARLGAQGAHRYFGRDSNPRLRDRPETPWRPAFAPAPFRTGRDRRRTP
jgi:F-type H+-transporting ATPase subunit b